jgi:hypothetical protein
LTATGLLKCSRIDLDKLAMQDIGLKKTTLIDASELHSLHNTNTLATAAQHTSLTPLASCCITMKACLYILHRMQLDLLCLTSRTFVMQGENKCRKDILNILFRLEVKIRSNHCIGTDTNLGHVFAKIQRHDMGHAHHWITRAFCVDAGVREADEAASRQVDARPERILKEQRHGVFRSCHFLSILSVLDLISHPLISFSRHPFVGGTSPSSTLLVSQCISYSFI